MEAVPRPPLAVDRWDTLSEQKRVPFAQELGELGVTLIGRMFSAWHAFCRRETGPFVFRQQIDGIGRRLVRLLEAGRDAPHPYVASKCRSMLKFQSAFFTFAQKADVEPTNNRAERALRHAVLYRKSSLGTQSSAGSRYVERILTVVHTLKAQGRSLLDYLFQAALAALSRTSAPTLLPATPLTRLAALPAAPVSALTL